MAKTQIASQLDALRRIAEFSAKARGHQLSTWQISEYSARAVCTKCGGGVSVHVSLMQPDIDGAALDGECGAALCGGVAA
jgi:hypothetical protein